MSLIAAGGVAALNPRLIACTPSGGLRQRHSFARFQAEDEPPAGVRVPVVRPAEQFWNAAGTGLKARWSVEPLAAPLAQQRTLRLTLGPLDNPADIVAPDLAAMSAFSKVFRLGKPSIGPGASPTERVISWPLTPLRREADTVPSLPYRYFDPKRRVPDDRWELRFPTTQVESIPITILPDVVVPPPRSPLILPALATELVSVEAGGGFRVRGWMWGIGPLVVALVAGYRRWTGSDRRAAMIADRHTRRVLRRLHKEKLDAAEVREVVLAWCERHYLASRQHLPGEVGRLVEMVDRGTFSPHSAANVGETIAEIERLVVNRTE